MKSIDLTLFFYIIQLIGFILDKICIFLCLLKFKIKYWQLSENWYNKLMNLQYLTMKGEF